MIPSRKWDNFCICVLKTALLLNTKLHTAKQTNSLAVRQCLAFVLRPCHSKMVGDIRRELSERSWRLKGVEQVEGVCERISDSLVFIKHQTTSPVK